MLSQYVKAGKELEERDDGMMMNGEIWWNDGPHRWNGWPMCNTGRVDASGTTRIERRKRNGAGEMSAGGFGAGGIGGMMGMRGMGGKGADGT